MALVVWFSDAVVVFTPLSSFLDATAALCLERCPNINIKYPTIVHLQPKPKATKLTYFKTLYSFSTQLNRQAQIIIKCRVSFPRIQNKELENERETRAILIPGNANTYILCITESTNSILKALLSLISL